MIRTVNGCYDCYFIEDDLGISDGLLTKAKRLAREQNATLRSLVEEGLRKVIDERSRRKRTCVITGKEIGTLEQNHPTPKWCPLRRRDVIVNLKESKGG